MFFHNFQMSAHPFSENPGADRVLLDERFEEALARLKFFREHGNLALVIGQTGVGKTTLIELFRERLPKNRYRSVLIQQTNVSPNAFLRMIVASLGEAPRLGKDRLFSQIVERIRTNETQTILIVDEAHLLPSQALTDLRLLAGAGASVKIILAGQEPLSAMLKRSAHADLVNRLGVRFRLAPLTKSQSLAYIDHRLRRAGSNEKLFEKEAKELIHDYSGGVPRQINNIATACLLGASSKNLQTITENLVNEIMAEFRLP
jgi:general secretion pathway protein A